MKNKLFLRKSFVLLTLVFLVGGFFVAAPLVYAVETTVTTPAELTSAISGATSGDIILVSGTLGAIDAYTIYSVHQPITIRGVNTGSDKAKVFGTFLLYVDGVTVDNLSITNKGIIHPDKNAINLLGKQVTITNNDFNLGNGTGGVANGVVIWPFGVSPVSLNITGNTFTGYSLTVPGWSSTALLIAEEINATPFTGTPLSTTIIVPDEESFANGNTYINNSYDYVHQNWNGGSKWFYSRVSNSAGLSDALLNSATGATILVAAGNYTMGQIVINKNLTITGDSSSKPVIQPSGNFTGANASDSWILVQSGFSFNLSNVVIDGNTFFINRALRSHGNTTVNNVDFRRIWGSANGIGSPYQGMAITSFGGTVPAGAGADSHSGGLAPSNLVLTNSTFEQIGRIGVLVKGTQSSATITDNTYTGKGDGDFLDYAFEAGAGGSITVSGNTISGNRGVASDTSTSAGILVTDFFGTGTSATIEGNTITNNTDGIATGFLVTDVSIVEAHNNKLNGNTNGVSSTNPLVNATQNWWGNESGPNDLIPGDESIPETNAGTGSIAFGAVNYSNWCVNETCTPPSPGNSSGSRRATPAIPATPAVPGVSPAIPATPAIPGVLGAATGPIPGCGNRTTGFSSATGQSCIGNSVGQVLGAEKFNFTLFLKWGPPFNVKVQGPEVMELQTFLNTAGYGPLVVDGKFGGRTKAAVVRFQIANSLKGDGIIGPLTRAALNR